MRKIFANEVESLKIVRNDKNPIFVARVVWNARLSITKYHRMKKKRITRVKCSFCPSGHHSLNPGQWSLGSKH